MNLLESVLYSLARGNEQAFLDQIQDSSSLSYTQKQALIVLTTGIIFLFRCMGIILLTPLFGLGGIIVGKFGGIGGIVAGAFVGAVMGFGIGFKAGYYAGLLTSALICCGTLSYNRLGTEIKSWFKRTHRNGPEGSSTSPTEREVLVPLRSSLAHSPEFKRSCSPPPPPPPSKPHYGELYRLMTNCLPRSHRRREEEHESEQLLPPTKASSPKSMRP